MLKRIDEYSAVLESDSARLLPFVDWQATAGDNVDVRNDTADYYRYFDATRHAEFLYACVAQTVDHDLPAEVRFLEAFDAFSAAVKDIVEMPDRDVDRLRGFLAQGNGRLSQRARAREFRAFTDAEVATVEGLYAECFGEGVTDATWPALRARALVSPQQRQVDRHLVERFDPDDHTAGVQREPDPPVIVETECLERSLQRIDEPCIPGRGAERKRAVSCRGRASRWRATTLRRPSQAQARRRLSLEARASVSAATPRGLARRRGVRGEVRVRQ